MKKYGAMLIFILFCQCGLPNPDSLNNMNPPMGLWAEKQCAGPIVSGVKIHFYGYNSESFFSGYNVYVVKSASPWTYDLAKLDVSNHIQNGTGGTKTFNPIIENNEILKNSANGLPSIPYNDLVAAFPNFRLYPTEITKTFTHTPLGSPDGGNPFANYSNYYFVVTAVSLSTRVETVPSNVFPNDAVVFVSCP